MRKLPLVKTLGNPGYACEVCEKYFTLSALFRITLTMVALNPWLSPEGYQFYLESVSPFSF